MYIGLGPVNCNEMYIPNSFGITIFNEIKKYFAQIIVNVGKSFKKITKFNYLLRKFNLYIYVYILMPATVTFLVTIIENTLF